jgi:DNA-binding LacI/PurR family transcriptional regulator
MNTHKVIVDNYKGAYDATLSLIREGFKNIAAISNSESLSITSERLAGYKAALKEHSTGYVEPVVMVCPHGGMIQEEVEEAIAELLNLKSRPDAILALSNSDLTELIDPALSIIKQPAIEMGEIATELLLQLIESKRPVTEFETRVMAPELIIRDSSRRQKLKELA